MATRDGHPRGAAANAHPHVCNDGSIAVVHNGIIENHKDIRTFLENNGYKLKTNTDTEVIPNLIHYFYSKTGSLRDAVVDAVRQLKGSYAIVVLAEQGNRLYAARKSSPMVVASDGKGAAVASDISALPEGCNKAIYPDDDEIVEIEGSDIRIYDLNILPVDKQAQDINISNEEFSKQGFPHFMLKEIHESVDAIKNSMAGRVKPERDTVKLGGLKDVAERLKTVDRLLIVACGTSYYAGMTGKYFIEEHCRIPVEVRLASEFRYHDEPLDGRTAILAISQSGETADTLEAVKLAKQKKLLTLGLVNVVGSSIARETDAGVYTHAGPEIGVASTKAFVCQVVCLYMIGMYISGVRSREIIEALLRIPDLMSEALAEHKAVKRMAEQISTYKNTVFIGRKYMYPLSLEAALKLKEVSYIHAEGYSAGELKHGPLALIDNNFATIALAPYNDVYDKTASNLQEVHARKGPVFAFGSDRLSDVSDISKCLIKVPGIQDYVQPFATSIYVQLLAYYAGTKLGYDVDKPRNLAKSVTVE
ncbi:glutamine--fructose-6-phosphate transaminase (isomerizing) [Candidatus Nomurabacteria bacterium]|nr:glutamine--fructose-6-phosphate transaminase (isomerizing) [Candidatus Nomurabacteria bacterium]